MIIKKRINGEEEERFALRSMDDEFESVTGAKKRTYAELVKATNNFAEGQKLGEGRFGSVYRGSLKDVDSEVAVKRISTMSRQGVKEYASEVTITSRLRHKNLVELICWCHEKKELLLVYEFMSNGSLDSHLFNRERSLMWPERYKIAQGLAYSLHYLHFECEPCVLHRDIKASNVMLDSDLNAKLGDFSLARIVSPEKALQSTKIGGTFGYMAPEYALTGRASQEADVYSFGVVVLEIVCGRKPITPNADENQIYKVEWLWGLYARGKLIEAADPRLEGNFDKQQIERLTIIGLCCAHPHCSSRPSMKQVISMLNFEVSLPILELEMSVSDYF
ncbi:L-type lectin-domain containing receptor kinase IX.1-like [Hibiscus syriacus]|nr:L-type lectin-domain containing receptor kinase IX.1-like [Hibiscus syriacus]